MRIESKCFFGCSLTVRRMSDVAAKQRFGQFFVSDASSRILILSIT